MMSSSSLSPSLPLSPTPAKPDDTSPPATRPAPAESLTPAAEPPAAAGPPPPYRACQLLVGIHRGPVYAVAWRPPATAEAAISPIDAAPTFATACADYAVRVFVQVPRRAGERGEGGSRGCYLLCCGPFQSPVGLCPTPLAPRWGDRTPASSRGTMRLRPSYPHARFVLATQEARGDDQKGVGWAPGRRRLRVGAHGACCCQGTGHHRESTQSGLEGTSPLPLSFLPLPLLTRYRLLPPPKSTLSPYSLHWPLPGIIVPAWKAWTPSSNLLP